MTEVSAKKRRQLATGLGLSAAALLIAFTGDLVTPANWLTPNQSASFFPAAALIGTAICGLFIAGGASSDDDDSPTGGKHLRSIGIGVVVGAYAIVLPIAGLIVSTLALSVVLPLALGYRHWGEILVLAVTIIGSSWLIFIRLMGIPLKL